MDLVSLYTPLSGENVLPWEEPIEIGDTLETLIQGDGELFSDALIESGRVAARTMEGIQCTKR